MTISFLIIRDPKKPRYRLTLADQLKAALRERGWKARFCDYDLEKVRRRIEAQQPDVLFTISFYPHLSRMAGALKIPYFCWEFDKIMNLSLFDPEHYSEYTWFFATYAEDVRRLRTMGVHACYLPACPALPARPQLSEEDRARYAADVTFAGSSLISVTNSYLQLEQMLAQGGESTARARAELWRLVNDAIEAQENYTRQGIYRLPDLISERVSGGPFAKALPPALLNTFLAKQCCRFQRLHLLSGLSSQKVRIYGAPDWQEAGLAHLEYGGYLDYTTELPKAFVASRINLNIARIYALDGMSDRVFNVLYCGGFLLSNPVEGLTDCFEEGEEIALYRTGDELREACAHYLAKPELRRTMIEAAQARIEQAHRVPHRLDSMWTFFQANKGDPAPA